jgi:hypothetical protein
VDFAYHRSLAPMMWAMFGLATLEMLVVHFLLFLWRPWVAMVVSLVSLCGIVWIGLTIRSFKRMPIRIVDGQLILRAGTLRTLKVDLSNVAGIRKSWDRVTLNEPTLLNLALIAWPNVIIDLKSPVRAASRFGSRDLLAVAHRLDDPTAFVAALPCKVDRLIRE